MSTVEQANAQPSSQKRDGWLSRVAEINTALKLTEMRIVRGPEVDMFGLRIDGQRVGFKVRQILRLEVFRTHYLEAVHRIPSIFRRCNQELWEAYMSKHLAGARVARQRSR